MCVCGGGGGGDSSFPPSVNFGMKLINAKSVCVNIVCMVAIFSLLWPILMFRNYEVPTGQEGHFYVHPNHNVCLSVRPSVCLSVCLSVDPTALCQVSS